TGGTLSMAASSTLPDFTDMVVSSGATFSLNGQNETIDSLTGSGTVNDNNATAATLSVGQGGSSFAFAGVLANGATGTFSLAKIGAGSFTLSGANTFTGTTTITAGEIASGISASFAGLAGQVFFNGGA